MKKWRSKIIVLLVIWIATLTSLFALFLRVRDHHLVVAAGPRTSESFQIATAISDVLETRYPNTELEVFETQGSSENIRLLQSGHADLATVQADAPTNGGVHAIASLYLDAYQLVALADSNMASPADLVGHRIAIGPAKSGQNDSFWFVANHYGLEPNDVIALPMATDAADFALRQKQVDAVFRVRARGNASIRRLVRGMDLRVVPIPQASALALKRPTIMSGSIARGSYRGHPALPKHDVETALTQRLLVARGDLDADLVHTITRLLFEERSQLVSRNPLAGSIVAPNLGANLSIPIHRGALRYYDREKPTFWQQNARILAPSLYVIVILTSAFLAIRSRLLSGRRVRVGDYNLELMKIADEAESVATPSALRPLQERLVAILRRVVDDLDQERVSQDEFEHFTFTWSAVDTLVRDRRYQGSAPFETHANADPGADSNKGSTTDRGDES